MPRFPRAASFSPRSTRFFDDIYRYCFGQLRNRERARVAAQQVFSNAFAAFARIQAIVADEAPLIPLY